MNIDPIKREHEVDEWLESALRQYGKAEPRAGLENRVLASLQFERTRTSAPNRWWWVAGTATVLAAIAIAVFVWQDGREARPANTAAVTTTHRAETRGPIAPRSVPQIAHAAGNDFAKQVTARGPIHSVAVAAMSKLEQFPSPRPLSEQEKLLMSYVARDPEKAALVAQARAEALQRDREEEAAEAAKGNTE